MRKAWPYDKEPALLFQGTYRSRSSRTDRADDGGALELQRHIRGNETLHDAPLRTHLYAPHPYANARHGGALREPLRGGFYKARALQDQSHIQKLYR